MYSGFYLLLYPIKGLIPLVSVVLHTIDEAAREKSLPEPQATPSPFDALLGQNILLC